MRTRLFSLALLLLLAVAGSATAFAQSVTTPKQQFGHDIGDDYFLANYTQLVDYWHKLEKESKRIKVVPMGQTEEGRTQFMAIVTSPENQRKLEHYRDIARRMALASDLDEAAAQALAKEGKAVVWIDGGLHASEVLCAQELMETCYQMVSGNDPETLRILNDVVILFVHANPDGMDLCSDWYMRNPDPLKRSLAALPRLYQKYIGHDDNRDFYAVTQKETKNMCRVMFREWFPQIVYNHHQTGPAGTVMFAPPFRDPFNYNLDPLVPVGIDLVGAAMQDRFVAENKPGVTIRSGAPYSTWWNGGLRTTAYFHNMIGLLTETIGNPTPARIPFVIDKQLPRADIPFPIEPQVWHFRQSIDYSVTANKAVLDMASKYREQFLMNIYRMGRNSIKRGSSDHWTMSPKRLDALRAQYPRPTPEEAKSVLNELALRDPRTYIISKDQPDFPTAIRFVNTLIENGVAVMRAKSDFSVGTKSYPAGSIVIRCDQAFRPHILDMFEPQDHPNDVPYPGAPPTPPYDSAGWTLAFQMGVHFDRLFEGVTGPFEKVSDVLKPDPGPAVKAAAGYLLSHAENDSFTAINQLLKDGEQVFWLKEPVHGFGPGTVYVASGASTLAHLQPLTALGLEFIPVDAKPTGDMLKLNPTRIGLVDRYGGSMPSGWVRWILEQFKFPFDVVYPQTLDAGSLSKKYDVLILVDGMVPRADAGGRQGRAGGAGAPPTGGDRPGGGGGGQIDPASIPEEYRSHLGAITAAKTVPQLKAFLDDGGTIITIGSSANLAYALGLPIESALVEDAKPLPSSKFYVPGSLMQVHVDNTAPIAYGMPALADVMFDNSPAFKLSAGADGVIKTVAGYEGAAPLRSGWALGQAYLKDAIAAAEITVGKGKIYLFGPEITFRGQPHGTFKFLFNGIYLSTAR